MKTLTPTLDTHAQGHVEEIEMSLKDDRAIFEQIAGKIYANPLAALPRELICNANDSHAEAGMLYKRVDVYTPDAMANEFVVRDYGVGITHEQMRKEYCILGSSTKRNTSEQTGCFGWGSKCPLGYTDAYALRCFSGETVRNYAIGWNNKGKLNATLLSETPSTEPKGVEVRVPIKDSDHEALLEYTTDALKAFNHPQGLKVARPNLNGSPYWEESWPNPSDFSDVIVGRDSDGEVTILATIAATNTWGRTDSCSKHVDVYVGNVLYPKQPMPAILASGTDKLLHGLSQLTLFVPAEDANGEPVAFPTGNRENLQRHERTQAWVAKQLRAALDSYVDECKHTLQSGKWFDKVIKLQNFKNIPYIFDKLRITEVPGGPKSIKLDSPNCFEWPRSIAASVLPDKYALGWTVQCDEIDKIKDDHNYYRGMSLSARKHIEVLTSGVVIIDEANAWRKRLEQYSGTGNISIMPRVCLRIQPDDTKEPAVLASRPDKVEPSVYSTIVDELKRLGFTVVLMSELPKYVIEREGTTGKTASGAIKKLTKDEALAKLKMFNYQGDLQKISFGDIKGPVILGELLNRDLILPDGTARGTGYHMRSVADSLNAITGKPVYFYRKTHLGKREFPDRVQTLFDAFDELKTKHGVQMRKSVFINTLRPVLQKYANTVDIIRYGIDHDRPLVRAGYVQLVKAIKCIMDEVEKATIPSPEDIKLINNLMVTNRLWKVAGDKDLAKGKMVYIDEISKSVEKIESALDNAFNRNIALIPADTRLILYSTSRDKKLMVQVLLCAKQGTPPFRFSQNIFPKF